MKSHLGFFSALLLLGFLAVCPLSSAENSEGTEPSVRFYFVQMSDTHIGDGKNLERTKKIVDAINSLSIKIEFVAITGDIFADKINDKTIAASVQETLKKIKVPVHLLPGNHDILEKDQQQTAEQWMSIFGELSSKAEYSGVVCLFAYTEPLRKKINVPGYDLFSWLEKKLKEAEGKPILLFHHAPGIEDFYDNEMHPAQWKQEHLDKWTKMLNGSNVKAIFAGHFHRDELHWQGKIPLFVASAISDYWGRQASFRIYEYKNGQVSYSTQYIEMKD